jgi:DNA invertase Pin-like site-specific DNA recombinase
MPADNTAPLITAAHKRRELTRAKAIQALRELDQAGTPVTFQAVARASGVSRSWLYAHNDIRIEIERLRNTTGRAPSPPIPTSQRASESSLLQRLAQASQRNRQLTEENTRLRRQLAHALGDQRSSPRTHSPSKDTTGRSSITNDPR